MSKLEDLQSQLSSVQSQKSSAEADLQSAKDRYKQTTALRKEYQQDPNKYLPAGQYPPSSELLAGPYGNSMGDVSMARAQYDSVRNQYNNAPSLNEDAAQAWSDSDRKVSDLRSQETELKKQIQQEQANPTDSSKPAESNTLSNEPTSTANPPVGSTPPDGVTPATSDSTTTPLKGSAQTSTAAPDTSKLNTPIPSSSSVAAVGSTADKAAVKKPSVNTAQLPLGGEATVEVVDTIGDLDQTFLPPAFAWFTDTDSGNVGVLQGMTIRVFIMGIEVTDYLSAFNWASDSSPESITPNASLRLIGDSETFILTADNIFQNKWRDQTADFRTSESVKLRLFKYKSLENVYDLQTQTQRWNLNPNSCIFHSGDTIRAFARIPWTLSDVWQPIFTGYLEDPQVTQQATNQHSLDVRCVTIADKLNRARVATNYFAPGLQAVSIGDSDKAVRFPSFADAVFQTTSVDTVNLFSDVANPRLQRSFLPNTSIKSILEFIFYGNDLSMEGLEREESEMTSDEVKNKKAQSESVETKKALAKKDVDSIQNQINVLERKRRNLAILDPSDEQGKPGPRVQSIDKKLAALKSQLASKQASQKADRSNPANSQNKQGQNATPGATTDSTNSVTSEGVVRKHGFGLMDPALFFIRDFPSTGKTTVDDTASTSTSASTAAKKTDVPSNVSVPPTSKPSATGFHKVWPAGPGYKTITTEFHAVDKSHGKPHSGMDIAGAGINKKPLYAPIDGKTTAYTGLGSGGSGNHIEMLGSDGYYHRFYHLYSVDVAPGQEVKAGQQIGKIGGAVGQQGAGHSTGAHLHWEVSANSMNSGSRPYLNPKDWFSGARGPSAGTTVSSMPVAGQTVEDVDSSISQELTLKDSWDSDTIDTEQEARVMEWWHAKCLFGFANGVPIGTDGSLVSVDEVDPVIYQPEDFYAFAKNRPNAWLSSDEVTFIGNNSDWLGVYSPHGKAVSVAYRRPKSGFGLSWGAGETQVQDSSAEVSTTSRAQILTDFLTMLDYRWWITGNGDVVVDFPHYDLKPEDYGGWENYLMIEGEVWNNSFKENFTQIPSTFIIRGGFGGISASKGTGDGYCASTEIIYQLPNVLIRNGVQVKTFSFPFTHQQKQLAMLGMVQISKMVANSVELPMDSLPPILVLSPNCPVYLAKQDMYALVNSVNFSWQIGGGKVRADLKIAVSAVRVRMTPEQAFLENLSTGEDKIYQIELQKLLNDKTLSASVKQAKFEKLKSERDVRSTELTKKAQNSWDSEKSQYLDPTDPDNIRYRHIQGRGNLMMDYRKTSERLLKDSDKNREVGNSVIDSPKPILVGTPGLKDIQPNRSATLKNMGDGVKISDTLPTQPSDSSGLFTLPKTPDSDMRKALDSSYDSHLLNANARKGLDDHISVVSNFQPDFVKFNDLGSPLPAEGLGILGLKPSIVSQLDPAPKALTDSNLADAVKAPIDEEAKASLSTEEKMMEAQSSLKSNPLNSFHFSMDCGALAAKQLDKTVGSGQPLNPMMYSYAAQYGPKNTALAQVIKECDVHTISEANNAKLSASMQKWVCNSPTATLKDKKYPSVLESMSRARNSA